MKPVLLALCLSCSVACATVQPQPPAGTYSAQGLKAFNADQFIKDLTALSQTAINLNATSGKEHLSDVDTGYVRDFALTAGAAAQSYGAGNGTIGIIQTAYNTLLTRLSADAKINGTLATAIAVITAAVNALPAQ